MKQENKELLIKDLCSRLPYGVKVTTTNPAVKFGVISGISIKNKISVSTKHADIVFDCTEVKPYLFPLSSMTEEQEKEFDQLLELELKAINNEIDRIQVTTFEIDFYNKHHLDWRGLIPMGLANDATGLNIY